MALRTFRHNPALGGFGGESSLLDESSSSTNAGADAFCQIIKELVDNAVDACRFPQKQPTRQRNGNHHKHTSNKKSFNEKHKSSTVFSDKAYRVRINLDPAIEDDGTELLRVTVTDNGCGMEDIQKCVDAFQTSKGHNANSNDKGSKQGKNTSGRYGIGLTRKSFSLGWDERGCWIISTYYLFSFQFVCCTLSDLCRTLEHPSSQQRRPRVFGLSCRAS